MAATQMKLFGTTILFSETNKTHFNLAHSDDHGIGKEKSLCFEDSLCSFSVSDEDTKNPEESEFTNESGSSNLIGEYLKISTSSSGNPKTPSFETETDLHNNSKSEHSESNSENTPKKPDKLIPCPRCDSEDTKFCYYNNYNLTQPRYFCKNCQRYWTSGGTMRNVPVGSGRRKNKNAFDSHYCQIMVPEPYQASKAYGKVLNFGSYPRESFVSKPKFDERSQNCFGKFSSAENEEDRSSITSTCSFENMGKNSFVIQEPVIQNFENFSSIMFYPSPGSFSFPGFYSKNRDSRILGKRSRKMETISGPEKNNLWFPKASRFDDPSDGAKKSIWSSLGIKNEKNDETKGKVVFEAFKSNKNYERYVGDNSLMLQANPAALARSANFHEIV